MKRESHNIISYRNSNYKTKLDLLVVMRQHMWRVRDCKSIAGEHVTTQHKPLLVCAHAEEERG